jgi:hypothetical protein
MKTARALIVVGFVLGSVLGVLGQPGPLGNLSVNIVDGNGDPIREGTVLQASVRTNGYTIEGHGPFQDSWYKPRDARRSSFIGEIACGREVSVAVSAPGYRPQAEACDPCDHHLPGRNRRSFRTRRIAISRSKETFEDLGHLYRTRTRNL